MKQTLLRSRIAVLLVCEFIFTACNSEAGLPPVVRVEPAPAVQTSAKPQPATPQPNSAATAAPAPAVTQASWTPDALEELLAPVALYPDQLLGQILAASINSQEVLDGGNWLLQNQSLKANDLDAAAQKAGFGPAMRALVQYPSVVDMMCQEIDWTKQLGSAFNSDQKSVLDAVQRLRKEAADVGNLKSSPQQTVATKSEGGNVYIEVKPADPKIVYVPQYDPQAVYTTPPPATAAAPAGTTTTTTTTTTTATETKKEKDDGVSTEAAVATALIAFGVGVAVGSSMNDDYYYPHWGAGVYYGPRPFYPPAYVYRPVYGPAFRPAYGYASPPGYRNNYNNVRVNNNIVVNNNNNYYNRFDNNQNLRTGSGSARSPIASTQPRATQTPANQQNWKGQSGYSGARNTAANTRAGQTATTNRAPARTEAAAPGVDRGYGESTRTATRPATTNTAAARPSQPATARAPAAKPQPAATKESAFSGAKAQGGGNFDRAASARGNASVGSRPTSGGRARSR